jgi:hypothetical protein
MKGMAAILIFSVLTGCATMVGNPGNQKSDSHSFDAPTVNSSPLQEQQDLGPQLVIPATGGAPVMGIPVGGNLYVPVTGGAPIVGIPVGP